MGGSTHSKRTRRCKLGILRGGGRGCLPVGDRRDGRAPKARSRRRQWWETANQLAMAQGWWIEGDGRKRPSNFGFHGESAPSCLQLFQLSPVFFLKLYCVTSGGARSTFPTFRRSPQIRAGCMHLGLEIQGRSTWRSTLTGPSPGPT